MTREEATEILKAYRNKLSNSVSNQLDGDIKAFDMAIKALEQEPCEDAISRQAVLELAFDMAEIDGEHFDEPFMVIEVADIKDLPPVTPQQKVGRWIVKKAPRGYCDLYECQCGWEQTENTRYCPNCGCRMVEPQESEDKE